MRSSSRIVFFLICFEVAFMTHVSSVCQSILMLTLCGKLVPPILMITVVAHSLGVELGISMRTSCYLLNLFLILLSRNWLIFRCTHRDVTFVCDEFLFYNRKSLKLYISNKLSRAFIQPNSLNLKNRHHYRLSYSNVIQRNFSDTFGANIHCCELVDTYILIWFRTYIFFEFFGL